MTNPIKVKYIGWRFSLWPYNPLRSEIELRIECTNSPTVEFTSPIWRWQTWLLFLFKQDLNGLDTGNLEWAFGVDYPG